MTTSERYYQEQDFFHLMLCFEVARTNDVEDCKYSIYVTFGVTFAQHPDDVPVSLSWHSEIRSIAGTETPFDAIVQGLVTGAHYELIYQVQTIGGDLMLTERWDFRGEPGSNSKVDADDADADSSLLSQRVKLFVPKDWPVGEYSASIFVFSVGPRKRELLTLMKRKLFVDAAPPPVEKRSESERNLCLIDGQCLQHGALRDIPGHLVRHDDSDLAYRALGVGSREASCLARARQWHLYCGNTPAEPMTATFTPTSATNTFPDVDAAEDVQLEWVMMLHVNDGYLDFFDNFWRHYLRIQHWTVEHIIKVYVSSDKAASYVRQVCGDKVQVGRASDAGQQAFGFFDKGFPSLVQQRPSLILQELAEGRNLLYLDVDIVLLEDPFVHLTAGYDIWTSMDHENVPREKALGTQHCTGVMAFRAVPHVMTFVDSWDSYMQERQARIWGNQQAFNDLVRSEQSQWLMIMQLPQWSFPPGSLYFDQTFATQRCVCA